MPHRYLALVPQWDLLNLLADAGRREPAYTLRMRHEVTGLLRNAAGRISGVRYYSPDGPGELSAELTLVCDGRWSICRKEAGLIARDFPVKSDLWWFRLPPADGVMGNPLPAMKDGVLIGAIPRGDYLQAARFLRKGDDAVLRARGIEVLRKRNRGCPSCAGGFG